MLMGMYAVTENRKRRIHLAAELWKKSKTLKEIGAVLGVSNERARQLKKIPDWRG